MVPTMCPISEEIEQDEGNDWLDVTWNHFNYAEIIDNQAKHPSEGEETYENSKNDSEYIEERL